MRDVNIWKRELLDTIDDIGHPERVKSLWFGPPDRKEVSSYTEFVAHVFDDFDIDGFLNLPLSESKIDEQQKVSLQKFRDEFDKFIEVTRYTFGSKLDSRLIFEQDGWKRVMRAASDVSKVVRKS